MTARKADYVKSPADEMHYADHGVCGGWPHAASYCEREFQQWMCPHCGALCGVGDDGLTRYHDWPKPTRQVCPGSKQNPRCAESDGRPLWNGERNQHFAAAGNQPSVNRA